MTPVRIETACIATPNGHWMYVYACGLGGVGYTLTREDEWLFTFSSRALLRRWDALCTLLRRSQGSRSSLARCDVAPL